MGKRTVLIGRAGSGKTRRVLDRVAEDLAERRERAALLLVPTLSQASHLKRLLLTRYADLSGFFDLSIVTFTGLCERVLPDRPIGELLSGTRQDLLMSEALGRVEEPAFRRLAGYPGFRRAALELLKELKQNGLPSAELLAELDRLAADREGALGKRMRAFRSLLHAYETLRVEERAEDHEDYLRRARDALAGGTTLAVVFLGVDGFQNFTRLERELLLLIGAEEAVVTLPLDPDREQGQFAVSTETLRFLEREGFRREALRTNHRARTPGLAHVEAGIFAARPEVAEPDGSVRVLMGADPMDEADRVARTVVRLCRGQDGPARRYRDIVIVVRDVRRRQDRFGRAFRRHGIPLRVYGAEDLAGHAFVKSVLALLRVAAGEVNRARVLALLRSDHLGGVPREAIDRLEHDVLEHGSPGSLEEWAERAGRWSPRAGTLLRELGDPAGLEALPARELGARVTALVDGNLVPLWKRDLADPEAVRAEARAHREVRRRSGELDAALRREEAVLPLPDYLRRLADLLGQARAGRGDRRLDVVNMIDAREARQWEAPVVIVSGLVEGEFPRSPREDIFLPDRERERENREGRLAFRERLLMRDEERYLFYVSMTRARERLFLTWPATDGSGEETLRSLFLDDVLRLFPEGGIVSRHRLSDPLPREEETAGREDLRRRALLGVAEPYRPGTDEEERARRAAALHDVLLGAEGDPPDADYARAVRAGARFFRPPRALLRSPDRLRFPDGRRHSASSLQDFAQCPFKHFAGRTLRLLPPPRAATEGLDPLLLGTIAHEVLRVAFLPLLDDEPLPDDEGVARIFEEVFAAEAAGAPAGFVSDRARDALLATLRDVVAREAVRLAASGDRPVLIEADFSFPLAPDVAVRGRVDRVDLSPDGGAVVIDYKLSKRGFDGRRREEAREGAHFQLPLYLLALREAWALRPEGAVLYPLRKPRRSGYALEGMLPPEDPVLLDEAGLEELLLSTRERILDLDARVVAGEVAVDPRDPDQCVWCDFGDVCRVEAWRLADRSGR